MHLFFALCGSAGLFAAAAVGGDLEPARAAQQRARLYERVARVLVDDLNDAGGAREKLRNALNELHGRRSEAASPEQERALVQELLEALEVSHLALYSRASFDAMNAELTESPRPTLGVQLVEEGGRYFADWIYEGGPAEEAGLLRGDEVLAIDGLPPASSPRLDWRTDDAALPDPPMHALLCRDGEVVELTTGQAGGEPRTIAVRARPYSGAEAARASARVFALDDLRFGYLHLWFLSAATPAALLRELLEGGFRDCDALLLDLRGRGGYPGEIETIVRLLDPSRGGWDRPLIVLVHAGTRSAKEILAWRLRSGENALLVGEHTAGAVIPASFATVGDDAVLMYPSSTLGRMTELLEGKGVEPHVVVAAPLPHAGGDDPILSAAIVAGRVWCEARATVR